MNIYDISAKAGVSIATVSRVLNGSQKVSASTRRKIMNIIEETGYAPATGRKKGSPKTRAVGILCTSLLPPQNAATVEKLIHKLNAAGYETDLMLCGTETAKKRRAVELFTGKKINALIIQGADFMEYEPADNSYIAAAASFFPILLLNAFLDASGVYCAFCDLAAAVQTAADALFKKGKHRPVFLFPSMAGHYMQMLDAFKNACASNGFECPPEHVHICPDAKSAKDYVRSLLDGKASADAAITADAASADAVVCAALEAGLSVPDDFEAVGFTADRACSAPFPFTAIDCRAEEICAHAAECVTRLINKEEAATLTVFPALIPKP
ncbi:MAG: LacI family transcriptional regulator [Butyrivibrio sp.]|nr:LacI family transcriptional regulator [Butyrivibrio sp.]